MNIFLIKRSKQYLIPSPTKIYILSITNNNFQSIALNNTLSSVISKCIMHHRYSSKVLFTDIKVCVSTYKTTKYYCGNDENLFKQKLVCFKPNKKYLFRVFSIFYSSTVIYCYQQCGSGAEKYICFCCVLRGGVCLNDFHSVDLT